MVSSGSAREGRRRAEAALSDLLPAVVAWESPEDWLDVELLLGAALLGASKVTKRTTASPAGRVPGGKDTLHLQDAGKRTHDADFKAHGQRALSCRQWLCWLAPSG